MIMRRRRCARRDDGVPCEGELVGPRELASVHPDGGNGDGDRPCAVRAGGHLSSDRARPCGGRHRRAVRVADPRARAHMTRPPRADEKTGATKPARAGTSDRVLVTTTTTNNFRRTSSFPARARDAYSRSRTRRLFNACGQGFPKISF